MASLSAVSGPAVGPSSSITNSAFSDTASQPARLTDASLVSPSASTSVCVITSE